MNCKYIERCCFVGTHYALLLYLLYSSWDDIGKTHFILGEGLNDDEIAQKLPNCTAIYGKPEVCKRNPIAELLYSLYLRWLILPRMTRNTILYAQDHLSDSGAVIGNKHYTLIEDSQHKCSNFRYFDVRYLEDEKLKKSVRYPLKKLLYGGTAYGKHGNNPLCESILLSEFDEADYIQNKRLVVCDLYEAWKSAPTEKKDFILSLYGFDEDDIKNLNRSIILFTQPLYPDVLTESEHINLYKAIIDNYPLENLIIKTHPRDKVQYESFIPKAFVYRKKIPSQLLEIMGVRFSKAVTVFSSAASNFSYPISIDWYGTECHPKLLELFGHYCAPKEATICRIKM